MTPILYIGNKNYSSWSLRPWLALRWAGVAFEEELLLLGGDGYGRSRIAAVRAASPTGRVPALRLGDVTIADSLAITEWAAEQPGAALWPEDPMERALCRSAVAEMHSGFAALRRDLTMNIRRRVALPPLPLDTRDDLERLFELLTGRLEAHRGPWLFGRRTAADAFYAPVATRLRTYGVPCPARVHAWRETILADPDMAAWEAAAVAEPWAIPSSDALYAGQAPG